MKWHAAILKGLQDVKKRLTDLGFDVAGGSPQELRDRVEAELAKCANVTRSAKINLV